MRDSRSELMQGVLVLAARRVRPRWVERRERVSLFLARDRVVAIRWRVWSWGRRKRNSSIRRQQVA